MQLEHKGGRRAVAGLLCTLLALGPALVQAAPQNGLKIVVLQGADARHQLQQISAQPIIIRVDDANNNPVGGAEVTFSAPVAGPGGEFDNDSRTIRVTTGMDGMASAGPYHPNGLAGSYVISVRADYQGQSGFASIQQSNNEKKSRMKLIAILAAAGGVAGAVVATRKDSDSKASNAPTVTFGGAAVGAPIK